MSIVSFNVQAPMLQGVAPRQVQMVSTDNLATITAAGYLNKNGQVLQGENVSPSDVMHVIYSYSAATNSGTFGIFLPSFSNGIISLVEWVNPGDVLLPVVSGDFAVFNGTGGQIKDAGYLPSNAAKTNVVMAGSAVVVNNIAHFVDVNGTIDDTAAAVTNMGNIYAGASGTAGVLRSYPATITSGYLGVTGVANGGDFAVQLANVSHGQASIHSLPDPGNAASRVLVAATATPFVSGNLPKASGTGGLMVDSGIAAANLQTSSLSSPDAISDLIWYDVTATAAALAAAGHVVVQVSSGSKQYKVRDIKVNYAAAGLSGGGGDRLLVLTDGTTIYNNAGITAALLGTPVNTVWGGSGNPVAGTVAQNTSTAAGVSLYLAYSGGAADYTTGQIVVSVLVQRVA